MAIVLAFFLLLLLIAFFYLLTLHVRLHNQFVLMRQLITVFKDKYKDNELRNEWSDQERLVFVVEEMRGILLIKYPKKRQSRPTSSQANNS